tara:strand:+ start:589 stop:1005 length:417 start_codon:yes stop_codon:yes gene_type:complete
MTSTNILKNLFESSNIKEQFDMSKEDILASNNLIRSYLYRHSSDVPIEANPGEWSTFDYGEYRAINKVYKFNNHDHFMYFINEVLNESKRINHDAKLTLEFPEVEVVIYTHDINDVTEMDLELSKTIDEIYQDIFFIE